MHPVQSIQSTDLMTSEEKAVAIAEANQSSFYLNEDDAGIQIWNDGIYDASVVNVAPLFMVQDGQLYPHAMTITIMARTPTGDFLAAFEVTCRLIWTKNSNCRKLVRAILDHELTATQSVGMVNSSELVGNGCKVYLMRRKSPSYRSKRPYCLREVLPQSAGSWLKRADGRYEYVPAAQPSLAMN